MTRSGMHPHRFLHDCRVSPQGCPMLCQASSGSGTSGPSHLGWHFLQHKWSVWASIPSVGYCYHCETALSTNNLEQEELILAHCFRGFSSQSYGLMFLGRASWGRKCAVRELIHQAAYRNQRQKGSSKKNIQGQPPPSDLLPLAEPQLLRFLESSKVAPQAWDQTFNMCVYGDISHSNYSRCDSSLTC